MSHGKKHFIFPVPAILAAALFFSSCATGKEVAPSGFLGDYAGLKKGAYFAQQQIAAGADLSKYKAVKVAPVNLHFLAAQTACDTGELENLAGEFREDVEAQLEKQGFTATSYPGENTLLISLALTNVEPPDAVVNAGLAAASFATGVPMPFDKDGKTSFEGRITDAGTGEELARFAEERSGSGGKMDLKTMTVGKYQKFTNTEAVFTGWAETIAKMLKDMASGAVKKGGSA